MIVRGVVPNTDGSNVVVTAAGNTFARVTAWRNVIRPGALPAPPAVALTATAEPWLWKAPMSTGPVRGWPRWSVAGAPVVVPPPIAALPGSRGMVGVGPP